MPPWAGTALPDDSVVTCRDQTEAGDRAHAGQVLRDVPVTPLALAEGEGHDLGHFLPMTPNKAPSPLPTQACFSLQHKEEEQDIHPHHRENPLGQVWMDEPELLWGQEGSWEFPFMGVCSSNVYPALLFDQVPAQSSALRLVSALLTLPRQPGRDRTGTGLSPLREPQEGLSPLHPQSPERGTQSIPGVSPPSHHSSHTLPHPARAAQRKEGAQGWPNPAPHPCPSQTAPHSPQSREQGAPF